MRGYGRRPKRRPSGLLVVGALAAAVLIVGLVYIGVTAVLSDDDTESVSTTLPALTSTTSSTRPPRTTTTVAQYYEVQPGDSLFAIAERFQVRMEDIIALNNIENPDNIAAGDVLEIPPPTVLLNETTTSAGP